MVKIHVLTDRTYRYQNRNIMSVKREIEKKERDYNNLQLSLKRSVIKCDQMKKYYSLVYKQYCKLYELYLKSDYLNATLETAYNRINTKYNELSAQFDDLEKNYNYLLDELREKEQASSPQQASSCSSPVSTRDVPQRQENNGNGNGDGDDHCAHV